jgi:hypothetical protein
MGYNGENKLKRRSTKEDNRKTMSFINLKQTQTVLEICDLIATVSYKL